MEMERELEREKEMQRKRERIGWRIEWPPSLLDSRSCPFAHLTGCFSSPTGGNTAASPSAGHGPGALAAAAAGGDVERLRGGEAPQKLEAKIELECFNLLGEAPMWHETEVGVARCSTSPPLHPCCPRGDHRGGLCKHPGLGCCAHCRRMDAMGAWRRADLGGLALVVAGQALLA